MMTQQWAVRCACFEEDQVSGSKKSATLEFQRAGWVKKSGEWKCPNCQAKAKKAKPVKIGAHKAETTYRIGKWLVTVERKTSKSYACGSSRTRSWSQWSAINMESLSAAENKSGVGGIKQAAEKLG